MDHSNTVSVSLYDSRYKDVFRALNLEWIERYFRVEKKDLEQVNNPERLIASGGQIFFAVVSGKAVGTCAVYKITDDTFELAKMAVDPEFRGGGIGHKLMDAAEAWAVAHGARKILILSNTILVPAIALYRKHGYAISRLGPHPDYERCNIEMIKNL